MKLRLAGILWVVVVFSVAAVAQHNTEDFKVGSRIPRDTWTGTVKSLDHDKGMITLEYEHKGKVQSFTGVLKPPLQVLDQNGDPAKPPIRIQAGDRLLVHYIKEGAKYSSQEGGTRHEEVAKENLIVQINFLPAKD
jgi:hypothetical protein